MTSCGDACTTDSGPIISSWGRHSSIRGSPLCMRVSVRLVISDALNGTRVCTWSSERKLTENETSLLQANALARGRVHCAGVDQRTSPRPCPPRWSITVAGAGPTRLIPSDLYGTPAAVASATPGKSRSSMICSTSEDGSTHPSSGGGRRRLPAFRGVFTRVLDLHDISEVQSSCLTLRVKGCTPFRVLHAGACPMTIHGAADTRTTLVASPPA